MTHKMWNTQGCITLMLCIILAFTASNYAFPFVKSRIPLVYHKDSTVTVTTSIKRPKSGQVFTYAIKCAALNGDSLKIQTTLVNDGTIIDSGFLGGQHSVLDQKLIFYKNGLFAKKVPFPLKGKREYLTGSGRKIKIQDFIYGSVDIETKSGKTIYALFLWNLANGSKEIYRYYDSAGNLLYAQNCWRDKCRSQGSLCNIPANFEFRKGIGKNEWWIYPLKFAGTRE